MKKNRQSHLKREISADNEHRYLITPKDDVIYQKNMKAMREVYPKYGEELDKVTINCNYQAMLTGSEKKLNVYSRQADIFYYNQEDPAGEIKTQIAMLNLRNAKIAVFLGFGLGFMVDYYARCVSQTQGTQRIIIIERDLELFKTALTYIDYSPMIKNPGIKIILGEKVDDLFVILEKYFKSTSVLYFLKCIKTIYHESSFVLDKEYYLSVIKCLRESVIYILQFYGNDPHDSLIGVQNMLDNIVEIIKNPGINLLYEKFRGKPAVIASTGPSLNKNKHLLKGLEDKALILCPDASLRVLLDIGVRPHLVTSLERVPETVSLMTGFTEKEAEDVYYAATPVIPNGAYEVYPGPRIIVYRNFDHFKWLEIERGILDIKHSSANMAFKIAEALGCDPIILIGQDLAYSREGKTHASGTTFGEMQKQSDTKNLMVEGNDGLPIMTTDIWNTFRKGFEVDIAGHRGTCINSTEGGALINGTIIMPFQEAINKYITSAFDPLEKIKNGLSAFNTGKLHNDVEKILKKIEDTIEDLNYMSQQCMEGIEVIREHEGILKTALAQEDDKVDLNEIMQKILEYKKNVLKTNPTMQLFLMHIVQSFHIKFEIDMNVLWEKYDKKHQTLAEISLMHAKWYAVIHDIIRICTHTLQMAQEKILSLMDD